MSVYVIATIISLFFASLAAATEREVSSLQNRIDVKNNSSKRNFFAVLSALPLIAVAALRYEIGTDWPIYYDLFYGINEGTNSFQEPGFNLLNRIVYFFSTDFVLMSAVCSVITYSFIFKAIYDQAISYSYSILFFVLDATYFNSMNQVRQTMTVAMFLYAMKYLKQRKPIPYFAIILLACTIHTSALFFIPIYFLYGLRVHIKLHVISLLAGAVLMVPLNEVVKFVVSKTRYAWYLDSVFLDSTGFYIIGFVFSLIILFLYDFYYIYGNDKDDKDYNFMVNMQWLVAFVTFLTPAVPQSSRLLLCFAAPVMFCIPKMFKREHLHSRRVVLIIVTITIFLVKILYDIYVNDWYVVIPYQTLFDR